MTDFSQNRSRAARVLRASIPIVMLIVGCSVGLVLAELGMRAYEATQPTPSPPPQRGFFWERNPDFGWSHPAGHAGQWWNDQREFVADVRINSKGMRDVEHDYAKPDGVYRILLLGDSYMEALQVELEQSFPRQLERTLNAPGRRVEVINAGVSDWGTDNELLYFQHEGYKYQPDLVLLAFTTANDVRNNSPVLNVRVPYIPMGKPTYTLNPDGSLEWHPAPPPPPVVPPAPPPWWQQFRVLRVLMERVPVLLTTKRPPLPPAGKTDPRAMSTDMLVYAPTYSPEVQEAWRITKALVRELRQEAEAHGAKFGVFLVNGPWVHYDDRWKLQLRMDPEAQKTWIRRRPNDEINTLLWADKIPSVDLWQPFEAEKAKEPLFFKVDPHWTAAGHELAAKRVAEFLVAQHLVPPATSGH